MLDKGMENACESVSVKFYGYGFDACHAGERSVAKPYTGIGPLSVTAYLKAVTVDFA